MYYVVCESEEFGKIVRDVKEFKTAEGAVTYIAENENPSCRYRLFVYSMGHYHEWTITDENREERAMITVLTLTIIVLIVLLFATILYFIS